MKLKLLVTAFALTVTAFAADAAKPNIILCMTDDQGWGDVSYNGLTKIKTPNLDALAAAGLRFNRYWNPDTKFPPLSPAEAIKTIEIPKGCRMECIASEPMVEEPASFTFDGNGALCRCGDYEDVAEKILRTSANDLHAPYARHAQAILNEPAKP